MSGSAPITVVETPEFLSATRKQMTEEEREVFIHESYAALARRPQS